MGKIIWEIRNFVGKESKKPTAKYRYSSYKFHLIPVHDYSLKLAGELNSNKEIVELAALFHDVGSQLFMGGKSPYYQSKNRRRKIKGIKLSMNLKK